MKQSRLLTCIVVFYFIVVGAVGASFAHSGCNAPCCQDDQQSAQSHCCKHKATSEAEKKSAPDATCRSFCPHAGADVDDCQCSLETEDSEYLPVASFLPTNSHFLLACWVDDVTQQEEILDGRYADGGSHTKLTSPIFIKNSALLL